MGRVRDLRPVNEPGSEFSPGLAAKLESLAAAERLPATYPDMAQRWLLPLAGWLYRRFRAARGPLLVGLNGAQGTGKSTACKVLCLALEDRGLSPAVLALDDFYLDKASRVRLAQRVHPLLATRGVPGTHDVAMMADVIDALLRGEAAALPVFDKARDDRLPAAQWLQVERADVLLLEGWCIGARPQAEAELALPCNELEAQEDPDGSWRRYVNAQLAGDYASLFARLQALVMLKAPSLERVLEWRQLQEEKLAGQRSGSGVMNPQQVSKFVQHYERVTRHCLEEMPDRADYLLEVGEDHAIFRARHQ